MLTWKEFKACVEAQGVQEETRIGYIDVTGADEPYVVVTETGEVQIT